MLMNDFCLIQLDNQFSSLSCCFFFLFFYHCVVNEVFLLQYEDTSPHPDYLQGNFLSSQLTALIATLYPSPLFILKGSSAHSRLIRIITPPLLVFIIQFPSSRLPSAIHCQSATL